jgi:hypothetical protein
VQAEQQAIHINPASPCFVAELKVTHLWLALSPSLEIPIFIWIKESTTSTTQPWHPQKSPRSQQRPSKSLPTNNHNMLAKKKSKVRVRAQVPVYVWNPVVHDDQSWLIPQLNLNLFGAISGAFSGKSKKEKQADGSEVEHRQDNSAIKGVAMGNGSAVGAADAESHGREMRERILAGEK